MHKLKKYKTKLLKAKYRNNDWEKNLLNCTKNSRTFPGQNSENSKFQDKSQGRKKFQDISRTSRFSRTGGHPVLVKDLRSEIKGF